jgi:hypothetical protein
MSCFSESVLRSSKRMNILTSNLVPLPLIRPRKTRSSSWESLDSRVGDSTADHDLLA